MSTFDTRLTSAAYFPCPANASILSVAVRAYHPQRWLTLPLAPAGSGRGWMWWAAARESVCTSHVFMSWRSMKDTLKDPQREFFFVLRPFRQRLFLRCHSRRQSKNNVVAGGAAGGRAIPPCSWPADVIKSQTSQSLHELIATPLTIECTISRHLQIKCVVKAPSTFLSSFFSPAGANASHQKPPVTGPARPSPTINATTTKICRTTSAAAPP